MRLEQVRRLTPVARFAYWVREREAIRLRKEAGEPPPWTDDPILQRYRFCNVRRMDDKVSRWLLEQYYETPTHSGRDPRRAVVAASLARHFNQPSTLDAIQRLVYNNVEPDWDGIKATVRNLKAGGARVFNAAYMVRGIGEADKTEMVVERVTRPLWDRPPTVDVTSMERTWAALLPYWGFSSFMGGQVVADLRHVLPGRWADAASWAPVGPGSARGLARVLYGDDWAGAAAGYARGTADFLVDLRGLVFNLKKLVPVAITRRLEMMDWQNVMCEVDKYTRALTGEGRPKQIYPGGTR